MFTAAKAKANIHKSKMKKCKEYLRLFHDDIRKNSVEGKHYLFWIALNIKLIKILLIIVKLSYSKKDIL